MNFKPILIVAGEPYSVFSEIFFKTLKRYKSKKPIILIGSKKLFIKQMNKLGYKFKFNLINKNLDNIYLKKRNTINILNINFKFKRLLIKFQNRQINIYQNVLN